MFSQAIHELLIGFVPEPLIESASELTSQTLLNLSSAYLNQVSKLGSISTRLP